MKRMLITLLALAIGMTAFAQFGPGRGGYGGFGGRSYGPSAGYRPGPGYYMQEGALEFGITLNHFSKAGDTFRPDRLGIFGEYRVDVSPFVDMGLQLSTTFGKGSYSTAEEPYGPDIRFWQGAPLVVTDINLLPYSGFNPYFGLGIGPGFGYMKSAFADKGEWTQALVLSPRAGIELFECLRMSIQYQWYLNNWSRYSHWGFGISWAFGPGMGRVRGPRR
jgi:hypothetical protein